MDTIRVTLANDHPIVGAGEQILEQARHLFEDLAPGILLLEMTLADQACEPQPRTEPRVLVLQGRHSHEYVFALLDAGADPIRSKSDALRLIASAIQTALGDAPDQQSHHIVACLPERRSADRQPAGLTAREAEVLRQLTTGMSDRAIGERLGVSVPTIRYHLQHIYRKLGVARRSAAVAWAIQAGIRAHEPHG